VLVGFGTLKNSTGPAGINVWFIVSVSILAKTTSQNKA
jgi:hypothetical protein